MPMLDAALAFALTMMALASLTTLAVELLHRFFMLRAKGMRVLLEKLFEQEVAPWLKNESADVRAKAKEKFLTTMLNNPFADKKALQPVFRSVEELSDEEFWKRLGQTDLGHELRSMKKAKEEEFLHATEHLALKFDEYSKAASDFFDRRAKAVALVVGVLLAFILNANAIDIWNGYLADPALTQAVIESSDEYQTLVAGAVERAESQEEESTVEELEAYRNEIRALFEKVEHQGLAIGYDDPSRDWRQFKLGDKFKAWAGLVLTGFLFGLGGPFWFKLIVRLGSVRQAVAGGAAVRVTETNEPPADSPEGRIRLLERGAASIGPSVNVSAELLKEPPAATIKIEEVPPSVHPGGAQQEPSPPEK